MSLDYDKSSGLLERIGTLRSSISVRPFEQPFTVVKVTDAKYAEMLLGGDVYARPLNAFGGWDWLANIQNDLSVNNSFRGDCNEGAIRNVKWEYGDITLIDDSETKYMKCYSTMALQYHLKSMKWERADKKVTQFGDTAVVIANLDQFVDRIVSALNKKYGCDHCLLLADKISYYHLGITNNLVPMYSKEASYSWQNEFRIIFCETIPNRENKFARPDKDGVFRPNAQSTILSLDDVHLDIGDIRDIAYAIPVAYLIHGAWWSGHSISFATNNPKGNTRLENLVIDTRNEIRDYRTPVVRASMTIY